MLLNSTGASVQLASSIDPHVLLGLAIAVAVSIFISVVPQTQRPNITIVALLAAIAYYRWAFLGFAVVAGIAYLALRYLSGHTDGAKRWNWACGALVLLTAVFGAGRIWHWDAPVGSAGPIPLVLYGLDMWLMLRLVTLFWEVGSGTVAAPSLTQYVLWVCLPFTIGGPLLRFSEMPETVRPDRSLWRSRGWWAQIARSSALLTAGFAATLFPLAIPAHWPHAHVIKSAVLTFFAGPFGFYFSTAGYFGLMEQLARPSGFGLQPSFCHPFGRENISVFWMNWNRTATFVFRDYLFYNRWGRQNYNVYFNILLLFTLVGFWHAANAYWVLWGILNGLLFCTFLLWRRYTAAAKHLPLRGTPIAKTAARALTYLSVCMCWYLPSKVLQQLAIAI